MVYVNGQCRAAGYSLPPLQPSPHCGLRPARERYANKPHPVPPPRGEGVFPQFIKLSLSAQTTGSAEREAGTNARHFAALHLPPLRASPCEGEVCQRTPPQPSPTGGGGCLVVYIHLSAHGVCKWAMSRGECSLPPPQPSPTGEGLFGGLHTLERSWWM